MKQFLIVLALLGTMFAQTQNPVQCAEHNIYLSDTVTYISMVDSDHGAARCTPTTINNFPNGGSVRFNCPQDGTNGGMAVWGFDIQSPCTTTSVAYAVHQYDTSSGDTYDLGLYYIKGLDPQNRAGQLLLHTGPLSGQDFTGKNPDVLVTKSWATTGPSGDTGYCAFQNQTCTLPAGQYALALGTTCYQSYPNCAQLWGDDDTGFMYLFNVWFGGSSGSATGGRGVNLAVLPQGCVPGNKTSCTLQMASGLPSSISTGQLSQYPPVRTDPTLSKSRSCSNGCPKPPAVLIY